MFPPAARLASMPPLIQLRVSLTPTCPACCAACLIPTASMIDFYNGSGVDIACLGLAEVRRLQKRTAAVPPAHPPPPNPLACGARGQAPPRH
jgi:hypothetical protein